MDFLNQASKRGRSSSLALEVLLLIAINFAFYLLFSNFDLLESIYIYTREYEAYELDELVPMLLPISITLVIFASRRRKENKELNKLFDELSVVDSRTGLYNREYFIDTLTSELERCYRSGNELSLIRMKVDDLTLPNEELEDSTARQIILELAKIAESCCRDIDMITRWDFDELLILCRDTRVEGAKVLCRKILEGFRAFQFPEVGKISVSVGIAGGAEDRRPADLINRTEANLRKSTSAEKIAEVSSVA